MDNYEGVPIEDAATIASSVDSRQAHTVFITYLHPRDQWLVTSVVSRKHPVVHYVYDRLVSIVEPEEASLLMEWLSNNGYSIFWALSNELDYTYYRSKP